MSVNDIDRNNDGASQVRIAGKEVEVTGQFVHLAGQKKNIFFKGKGNVDRSITVVAAIAKNDDGLDFSKNGIAVIDNDNLAVLVEGVYPQASGVNGPSPKQIRAIQTIATYDWSSMLSFIWARDTYHKGVARDIDAYATHPDEGNFENQMLLGLKRKDQVDFRSDFARSIHSDGLYDLPATSKSGMINQLLMRPLTKTKEGSVISWDLSINPEWDLSGHVNGGEDIDPDFDGRWKREFRGDEDLRDQVFDRAFGAFFEEGFSVLEMEDAACELELTGADNDRALMRGLNGKPMCFENVSDFRNQLSKMEPEELVTLWMTTKILDQDFSRKQRHHDFQLACNTVRAEREVEWGRSVDDELSFS